MRAGRFVNCKARNPAARIVKERAGPLITGMGKKSWLWLEWALAFGVVPPAIALWLPRAGWIPVLWLAALAAGWRLRAAGGNSGRPMARQVQSSDLRRIGVRALAATAALILLVLLWMPQKLFDFPRERTGVWLAVMALYPLASVYPQELICRRWFFERYTVLFGEGRGLVAASALSFGWLHIVFINPVAVVLASIGGWLFAETYGRSRSLRLVCLEHAFYGDLIFTVGLGTFFYHGAVRL